MFGEGTQGKEIFSAVSGQCFQREFYFGRCSRGDDGEVCFAALYRFAVTFYRPAESVSFQSDEVVPVSYFYFVGCESYGGEVDILQYLFTS